jgi:predicted metal-binding protein
MKTVVLVATEAERRFCEVYKWIWSRCCQAWDFTHENTLYRKDFQYYVFVLSYSACSYCRTCSK